MKKNLPDYVDYRNLIRDHYALKEKPSVIRLGEQVYFALPCVLDKLEYFAWCERPSKKVKTNGLLHFNGRKVYINSNLTGQKIKMFETLGGPKAEDDAGKVCFLADYKTKICCPPEKIICGILIKDPYV